MKNFGYYIRKVEQKLIRGKNRKEWMNQWFRKQGIVIGDRCSIFCNIVSSEPYLISIGNNVTISNNVQLITHDNSIIKPTNGNLTDIFGNIIIGDNCFIGAHAIILPGVNICNNVIIASGSVVTRSISEENVIFGGNPAKRIGSWDQFMERNREMGLNVSGLSYENKKELILHSGGKLKRR